MTDNTTCSKDGCEKPTHSKGMCQSHYRTAMRLERNGGERKKPGPAPDPSKPRSRHGEARKREGSGRTRNVLGGTCQNGHLLTEGTSKVATNGSLICKVCRANAQRRHLGKPESDSIGTWNKDKTTCPKGHPYDYVHPTTGSRRCTTCHAEYSRAYMLKTLYDLTPDQFAQMLEDQGNACAACRVEYDGKFKVDHDHSTGAVRGILCNGCNIALGHSYENPTTLRALADYVEHFSETPTS
jgi:hypothetical protein